jgi:hypothetical protein
VTPQLDAKARKAIQRLISLGGYYDRQGERITDPQRWVDLMEDREEYRRVAEDTVGPYWVSTVWLGLDHNYDPDGPPLIFETMVFARDHDDTSFGFDFDMRRYSTEEEAIAGHNEMVTIVRASLLDVPDTLEDEL